MKFEVDEGKETRVTITGKLDHSKSQGLVDALGALKGKDVNTIVFECKELSYLSSSGIRAILYARNKIRDNMAIVMEDVCADVMEVLDVCNISKHLEFRKTD